MEKFNSIDDLANYIKGLEDRIEQLETAVGTLQLALDSKTESESPAE